MDDVKILRNRFSELAQRAYSTGRCAFTDFLGLAELDILKSMKRELDYAGITLWGGADGCERTVARFGEQKREGSFPFPICCLAAEPVDRKFADKLTHRDILGAIMALGIERDTVGDIYIVDNSAYILCLEKVRDVILGGLSSAKRT